MKYRFQTTNLEDPALVIDAGSFDEAVDMANTKLTDTFGFMTPCNDESANIFGFEMADAGPGRLSIVETRCFRLISGVAPGLAQ